jgi:hypothetical protein
MNDRFPIVGMFFGMQRPQASPSELLVKCLAINTPLMLCAEPYNPVDANAIAVRIATNHIPHSADEFLEAELPRYGMSLASLAEFDEWHLGYIPRNMTAKLRALVGIGYDEPIPARFTLSPSGEPRVELVSTSDDISNN